MSEINFDSVLNSNAEELLKAVRVDSLRTYYRESYDHLEKKLKDLSYKDLQEAIECMVEEQKRIGILKETINDAHDYIRKLMKL